jgi:uncharacterized protein
LLLAGTAQAEVGVPPLERSVTDLTNRLRAWQIEELESRLAEFEKKKGAQLAILIVPTTQPETIEQYSIRAVKAWKQGRKSVDDGVLLLVSRNDRKAHIEAGYGLEGALPDDIAKRIIADTIMPFFRNREFYEGIRAGITAIMQAINGEPRATQQRGVNGGFRADIGVGANRGFWENTGIFLIFAAISGSLILLIIFRPGFLLGIVALFLAIVSGSVFKSAGGGFKGRGGGFGGGGASGRW